MKNKLDSILKSIFSIFILIALAGGGVVFLLFIGALIVGGEKGAEIALNSKNMVMPFFIKSATVAVAAGLISFYNSKEHTLSLEDKDEIEESIEAEEVKGYL